MLESQQHPGPCPGQRPGYRTVRVGDIAVANHLPFALIAGPCQIESRAPRAGGRRRAPRPVRRLGRASDLQVQLRQGQPHQRHRRARRRHGGRPRHPRRGARPDRPAHAHRRARPRALRPRGRGGGRAADPRLPLPPDRSAACRRTDRAGRSTSRRASSSPPGTWPTWRPRSPPPATTASCCASAAPASATTRWSTTSAPCRSWRAPATRWCSTRRTRCSSRAGRATASGGEREFAPVLARAALAVGVAAVFIETHPDPDHAPSDGPSMIPLRAMPALIARLKAFDDLAKSHLAKSQA